MAVFIAGDRYLPLAYAKSPLAELLPVALTNAEGRLVAEWRQGSFGFAVTGAGYAHEIMRMSDSDAENVRIWETGCEWQRRLEGLTLRPGAETLAFASDSTALKSPLVVVQQRGRGKVVFLASDETWRFRYRIGDTYHHRFWGSMLKWGVGAKLRDGNAFARVGSEHIHYAPGEQVKIRARLSDAELLPLEGLEVKCAVTDPNGRRREFALAGSALTTGIYEGIFNETAVGGDYRVEIACDEAREKLGEKWPGRLETGFSVKEVFAPVEYAHLSGDRSLMEAMAAATGGRTLPNVATNMPLAAQIELLADDFGVGSSEVAERLENNVWDHPLGLLALCVALIIVWILRKRRGLA